VSVIIEPGENNQQQNYRVFCEDNEFSSLEYGGELFEVVAMHILRQRASSKSYPVYITDVDITGDIPAESTARLNPTIRFLLFKSHIESQLNNACDRIRELNSVNLS
jgi:adenylate cyclase class 1